MSKVGPIQNCHITKHTGKLKPGFPKDWMVEENITNRRLGHLPAKLTEAEVFEVIEFCRKYELEAFNAGVHFGKSQRQSVLQPQIEQLKNNLNIARQENERIADALDLATRN